MKKKYLVTAAIVEAPDFTKVNQFLIHAKSDKKLIKALWKDCDKEKQFNDANTWLEDHNDEFQKIAIISIVEVPKMRVIYSLNNLKFELEVFKNNVIEPK